MDNNCCKCGRCCERSISGDEAIKILQDQTSEEIRAIKPIVSKIPQRTGPERDLETLGIDADSISLPEGVDILGYSTDDSKEGTESMTRSRRNDDDPFLVYDSQGRLLLEHTVDGKSLVPIERFESLRLENDNLKMAIRKHRDAKGNDRCWENDIELYKTLGEEIPESPDLPSKEEFLQNCNCYYEQQRKRN